jgi:hypothetical protein
LISPNASSQVVISDFPDPSLVNQIQTNIDLNIGELSKEDEIAVTKAAVNLTLVLQYFQTDVYSFTYRDSHGASDLKISSTVSAQQTRNDSI